MWRASSREAGAQDVNTAFMRLTGAQIRERGAMSSTTVHRRRQRLLARRICHLPQRHRLARGAALPASARALRLGAGAAAGLAVHLRRRIPPGARRLHHPALRDLHPLRGLYRAGPDGDDPALQRHAVLALDGLRPRDGQHAHAAGEPAAALVSAVLQAARGHRGVAAAGLCLPADRLVLGHHAAADRLSHRAAGADPVRA